MTPVSGARLFLVVALSVIATGCGNGLVQVQGQVLLDDRPLPGAVIALIPQAGGRTVTAKSDAAGKFQLTTTKPNDGVAPGQYQVSVTAREVKFEGKPGSEEGYAEKHVWLAPERYSNPATSGLTATVSAHDPSLTLNLKSQP